MVEPEILESIADVAFLSSCRALSRIIFEGHIPLALLRVIKGVIWMDSAEIHQAEYADINIMMNCSCTLSMTVIATH